MKRLAPLLILLGMAAPAWGAYAYRATITLAQTTGSSDLTDRTNVVYLSDPHLMLAANDPGQIQHTCTRSSQTVPCDLIFTSDANGTVLLNWAVESYNGASGQGILWAHVKKTTSHTGTTTIYAFWGNPAITTFLGGAVGSEFDSSIVNMTPFAGPGFGGCSGTVNYYDFSSYQNTGTTNCSYGPTTGVVGSGDWDAGNNYNTFPGAAQYSTTTGTWSLWWQPNTGACNTAGAGGYAEAILLCDNGGCDNGIVLGCSTGSPSHIAAYVSSGGAGATYIGTGTIVEGSLNHIGITFQNVGTSTFYVAGTAAGTFTHSIGSPGTTPPLALTRGYGYSGWGAISGGFDQLYFANVIKSADWFAAEYNNDHAPATFAAVSGIGACVGTCGAGGSAATVTMTPIIM